MWAADFILKNSADTKASTVMPKQGKVRTACFNYNKMYRGDFLGEYEKQHLFWQWFDGNGNFIPREGKQIIFDMNHDQIHSHVTYYIDPKNVKDLQQYIMEQQKDTKEALSLYYNNCANWAMKQLKYCLPIHGCPKSRIPRLEKALRGAAYKSPMHVTSYIRCDETELFAAAKAGDICTVKTALTHGVSIVSLQNGKIAEQVALENGHHDLSMYLRLKKSKVDQTAPDSQEIRHYAVLALAHYLDGRAAKEREQEEWVYLPDALNEM